MNRFTSKSSIFFSFFRFFLVRPYQFLLDSLALFSGILKKEPFDFPPTTCDPSYVIFKLLLCRKSTVNFLLKVSNVLFAYVIL